MIDKDLLKKDFDEYLAELTDGEKPTAPQLHGALARSIMKQAAPVMAKSAPKGRSASYFSAEFLVGRAVYNNLMCLGLLDDAEALLNSAGASLCSLEEIEDAALGNGGLGRLAACFLDSAASMKLPLTGYGIRYSTDCSSSPSSTASRRRTRTTGQSSATRGANELRKTP